MVQRRVLYDERVPFDENLTSPGFLLALYFPFSFPLSWPVALNGRFSYVARKFEVTNFVLSGPPLWPHCHAAGAFRRAKPSPPCRKDLDSRIALDSLDTWHSIDLHRSLDGGPPRAPDSIQYHPSYFVRGGRNEKFSRESRWRALDKGYCYLQQYSGIGYINLGRFSFYLENISFVQSATLISRYHNYINSVAGFGSKIGNDGKRLISEIDRVIYYFDSLIIINICTYMTRYVVFFFISTTHRSFSVINFLCSLDHD